ncbi:ATP-binding protein [Geomesophilobacter sediminis]|uniref:ATP-binding protein n=1 Tax=Geomesophilobacter sediminis TaxID=2798584 RepID=A0A8J7IMC6_9BACT|nr:ATP-binding protein [Geomesophilobacter sediminis]MBJ6723858.1 ATP-binding protein [Geomesophilobacter sediminis]
MELDADVIAQLKRVLEAAEYLLPKPPARIDWTTCYAANWKRHAFSGGLEAIENIEGILIEDLLGIEKQKKIVEENTCQFLQGLPANNILLWGTRGTGKSSLVRALLRRYAGDGLRVIQVDKDDLIHLPDIVDSLKGQPYRFIIFSDDVSFEIGESSYKMLKSALDGAVYAPPENVLIYVTSNRRHLIPEYESDNRGAMMVEGEIHHGEAVEEKISLSGRFGIWVAFHPFTQDQYLEVVRQWVERLSAKCGKKLVWDQEVRDAAVLWSQKKGDRSGRIAYQFSTDYVGQSLLKR